MRGTETQYLRSVFELHYVHYMHTPQQTMSNGSLSLPTSVSGEKPPFIRPTANFHPSVWGDRFLSFVPSSAVFTFSISLAKMLHFHGFNIFICVDKTFHMMAFSLLLHAGK